MAELKVVNLDILMIFLLDDLTAELMVILMVEWMETEMD